MSDFWAEIGGATFDNEASVETRLILPLLDSLGYARTDVSPKHRVIFQEGKAGRPYEADFAVFYGATHNRQTSLIVVEAKTPGESFADAKSQAESYVTNLRAPVYIVSDGIKFCVWQLQLTQESECVLDVAVASLLAQRGKIETLLSKEAMFAYCKTLSHKTLLQASTDYSKYIANELLRASEYKIGIPRTLTNNSGASSKTISSMELLEQHEGAIVVGPSGFGKSTLAHTIYSQALDLAWSNSDCKLAFDVQLPELVESQRSLVEYITERLSAHCPFVTESSLKDILRERGVTLICDGFDRVITSKRYSIQTELKTAFRDYPKLQLFIFSRLNSRPDLPIQTLHLDELTKQQQHDFRVFANTNSKHPEVMWHLPDVLSNLCWHPLLLQLITSYLIQHHRIPNGIGDLFDSWLSAIVSSDSASATTKLDRENALSIIAQATIDNPLTPSAAIVLLERNQISKNTYDELLACDAIVVTGRTIEVIHESLADYLRALKIVSLKSDDLIAAISSAYLRVDSLFPILLMSMLPTRSAQRLLWEQLTKLDLAAYLNALRFQADISLDNADLTPNELAYNYLEDILDGISQPLNAFFGTLKSTAIEAIAGKAGTDLAIAGARPTPAVVSYQIGVMDENFKNRINIGRLVENHYPIYSCDLKLSGTRIDSGRELGAARLYEGIVRLIKKHNLVGGDIFINERLIGRLRLLNKNFGHPDFGPNDSLDTIEASLSPFVDQIAVPEPFRERWEPFYISELIQDIKYLRQTGMTTLDQWWLKHGGMKHRSDMSDDEISFLLNEHYRRVQLAYVEVVNKNFGQLAHMLGHFPSLPGQWDLVITRSNRLSGIPAIHFRWLPAEKWDDAGANVAFSEGPPNWDMEADYTMIVSRLVSLGRPTDRGIVSGFRQMPQFDGNHWLGSFDGETSVMREVTDMLLEDIKALFKEVPTSLLIGEIT